MWINGRIEPAILNESLGLVFVTWEHEFEVVCGGIEGSRVILSHHRGYIFVLLNILYGVRKCWRGKHVANLNDWRVFIDNAIAIIGHWQPTNTTLSKSIARSIWFATYGNGIVTVFVDRNSFIIKAVIDFGNGKSFVGTNGPIAKLTVAHGFFTVESFRSDMGFRA